MKSDILAFAAHPDDVELACSGSLIKHIAHGKKVGIVDLTQGQLGSRGTPAIRLKEAEDAAKIMGLAFRENLGMEDGWFRNDKEHIIKVIPMLRKYRPDIVLANAVEDRHPDHGRAASLISEACFFSGLVRIETELDGKSQEAWKPRLLLHYIQDRGVCPDLVVDITSSMDSKMEAILAYRSQFYNPESNEVDTPISSKEFLDYLMGRAREMGRYIGVEFGEGFTMDRPVGVDDLTSLS